MTQITNKILHLSHGVTYYIRFNFIVIEGRKYRYWHNEIQFRFQPEVQKAVQVQRNVQMYRINGK